MHHILHGPQSILDLSLQIGVHEEGGDDSRDHDDKISRRHNLNRVEHFPDDEGDHDHLDDYQGDGTLEHRLPLIQRQCDTRGESLVLWPHLDHIRMDHGVHCVVVDAAFEAEVSLWLLDQHFGAFESIQQLALKEVIYLVLHATALLNANIDIAVEELTAEDEEFDDGGGGGDTSIAAESSRDAQADHLDHAEDDPDAFVCSEVSSLIIVERHQEVKLEEA